MALTRGDDYPIHQTPDPIAYGGTDRNFYDRYFFNGYHPKEGEDFFAAAFGVYPHLNITDAAFVVVRDGVETALHASGWLGDRMDLEVGPIKIEILEPLHRLKLIVNAPDKGLKAEIVFTSRAAPIEEPRFIRRISTRAFMDYTRLTQNGHYEGWIELDGVKKSVDGFVGTRDRSWGVRPVGARDSQEVVPPQPQQFFWLWSPLSFDDGSFFFHSNDDALGRPWNTRAVWTPDGSDEAGMHHLNGQAKIEWKSGTRHARSATIQLTDDYGKPAGQIAFEPEYEFLMLGLGYTHPKWSHGHNHGQLAVEREDIGLAQADPKMPFHLHVQALSKVTFTDAAGKVRKGRGVLEQLAIGPHGPSGFKDMLDFAP
ncbi:hypothetical protein QO010_000070 [Caulobacter ginsengisoli]|uniref:Uncharacterized protein n=1 Tax=Caulobacter ginsengisoli TaxID=400775 RepID=A0ABU0IK08_9CAUL|nr:hypothetical protein [Caulobacter ginsengisoli]MDQ0462322.1 hypothetical protein [Caulobacter ginsengisoli]